MIEHVAQGAAGLHDLGRKVIHVHVRLVGEQEALGGVEHAQALRHVVERGGQMPVLPAQAVVHDREHDRKTEDAGEGDP